MQFILSYILINFIFGLIIYFYLHDNYKWTDLMGFSVIYSISFSPIIIYFLRLLKIDNGLPIVIIIIVSILVLIKLKHKKFKISMEDTEIFHVIIALTFLCAFILFIVYNGFIMGSVFDNNVVDSTKQYGVLISAASSNSMKIDNPFATSYQMFYYFFYYFKAAEVLKLSGASSSFQLPVLVMYFDSILIYYSFIFLFFKIGKVFKTSNIFIFILSAILLIDGGFDSIYLLLKYDNEIVGGYIDGWVRVIYEGFSVSPISHSNFLIKLIWQPQHVSAVIPFLLFIYLIFYSIKKNDINYKYVTFMSLCTVSILGYSALITIPAFLTIGAVIIILIISKKMMVKYITPFIMAFIISIPILYTYIGHDGSSSKITFRIMSQYYEIIKKFPIVTLAKWIIEYGVISIVFIAAILFLIVKKTFQLHHYFLLIILAINTILIMTIEMKGLNDIGMAMSFFLYVMLFVFALTVDMRTMLKRSIFIITLLILLIPCVMTNTMGVFRHNTMNISLKNKNSNIMLLSDYMRAHTNYNDSVIIFSKDANNLNNFIPMLMHTKTFYPFFQGPQYLRGKELDEVNEYINTFDTLTDREKIKQYISYGIDYFIVLPDSQEYQNFKNMTPVYSNSEFKVYKAKEVIN